MEPSPVKATGDASAPKIAVAKAAPARTLPQRAMKAEPMVTPTGDDALAGALPTKKLFTSRLAETVRLKAISLRRRRPTRSTS